MLFFYQGQQLHANKVQLLVGNQCPKCKGAEEILIKNKVNFTCQNIQRSALSDTDLELATELALRGITTIPVLVVREDRDNGERWFHSFTIKAEGKYLHIEGVEA